MSRNSAVVLVLGIFQIASCRLTSRAPPPSGPAPAAAGRGVEAVAALPPEDAALAAKLEEVRARYALPGIAAMALDASAVVANAAAGSRALGREEPLTPGDRFHLGSCTKAMTATLIAKFVERGVLRFEDTLGDLFPDEGVSEGLRAVTLEQVLAQVGGVSDAWMDAPLRASLRDPSLSPMAQRKRVTAVLLPNPPASPPGTKFEYANANYLIAGAALERRTGKSWEALMVEELFEPLGMRSCGFGPPARAGQVDAPWGHVNDQGKLVPIPPGPDSDNPPALGPAGTVHCALADWGRFAQLHVRGAKDTSKLLTQASFDRLHRPHAGSPYALGWIVAPRSWAQGAALTHSGSNTLFYSTVWAAPSTGRVYLAATNAAPPEAARALDEVIGFLITRP